MKRISLLLLLSSITLVSFANSPVNFGLNFQLNMPRATLESTDWGEVWNDVTSSSNSEDLQEILGVSDLGYAGGIFLRFNKDKGFLHTEAMFSFNSSGFTALEASSLDVINYSTESTTFNLPVYLGRNLINSQAFKMRAFTGPQFTWIMSASASGTRDGEEIEDVESDFEFDDFTWMWSLGAGIEIFMLSLDARYGFDLKGIEGANGLEESFTQKTNVIQFTLGFKFF